MLTQINRGLVVPTEYGSVNYDAPNGTWKSMDPTSRDFYHRIRLDDPALDIDQDVLQAVFTLKCEIWSSLHHLTYRVQAQFSPTNISLEACFGKSISIPLIIDLLTLLRCGKGLVIPSTASQQGG